MHLLVYALDIKTLSLYPAPMLDFLKSVDLFQHMEPDELVRVAKRMTEAQIAPGSVVFRQGDESDSLCILRSGSLHVIQRDANDEDQILAELEAGEFFGEMGLMKDQPRGATIIASEPTTILTLPKADFLEFFSDHPLIRMNMRAVVAHRASDNLTKKSI